MNIVEILKEADHDRKKLSHEKNEMIFKNLLSHGYKRMEEVYKKTDPSYGDTLFMAVQDLLIWIMFADNQLIQGEYDAYEEFCSWAKYEALSVKSVIERKNELTIDYLISVIKHIVQTRKHIPDDDYESFVKALCYMALFGDKDLDQEEYVLISCFFNEDVDYCPSWEDYLKEK